MNAADPKQVEVATKKAERARDRELNDLRVVLASPQGRRFLWRQLQDAGIYRCAFYDDARYAEFVNGMRNAGCRLLADIHEADANAYHKMATEAHLEKETYA